MDHQTIRIFISSPGDVTDERDGAKRVIEGLQRLYQSATLEPVLWEELALPATASFQETIDYLLKREPIDVAVFILWSRLGSPLGAAVTRPDGTPYRSGTEREFDLMLAAFEQSGRTRPVILAYVRDDDAGFKRKLAESPKSELAELINQQQLAEAFITEQFQDAEGRNLRAYQTYHEPIGFLQRLRVHLRSVLDDLLDIEGAATWTEEPYRGLETFDLHHAPIFFGREEETCQLLQRLRDQEQAGRAFVVIVGASGSGKSSLARAGVAANLVQHAGDDEAIQWRVASFIPALADQSLCHALVRSLADSLPDLIDSEASANRIAKGLAENAPLTVELTITPAFARANKPVRLLLILDQMEELWTDRHTTAEDRESFLTAIEALAGSGHVAVLATLRSDFYHHAQQSQTFLKLKGKLGHYDLLPPDAASIHRLISEPARLSGLKFERNEQSSRSLDDVILEDASRDPNALPLLEYTLSELYRQRDEDRHLLTYAAYVELGGVEGAIGKRADETFTSLPKESQAALDEILPLLVSVDVGGEQSAVRRRAGLAELISTPARQTLTERLIADRFLTTDRQGDQPIASLAHEALLRSWSRIVSWIRDNREQLRLRARVEQTQLRWEQQDRDKSLLMAEGLPLDEGRQLLREAPYLLTASTQEYIDASIAHHDAETRRSRRVRRTVLSTIAGLLMAMIVGGIWMHRSRQRELAESLVSNLGQARGIAIPYIIENLRDVPHDMALEELGNRFGEGDDSKYLPIGFAMAEFGDSPIDFLVSALESARAEEVDNFLNAFGSSRRKAIDALREAALRCDATPTGAIDSVTGETNVSHWRYKARLAMLSLQLGEGEIAADMTRLRPDPVQRTLFIDEASSWCANLVELGQIVQAIDDAALRSAICSVVGGLSADRIERESDEAKETLQNILAGWYLNQPDTGTHGASGWALRQWGMPLPDLPVGEPERSDEFQREIDRLTASLNDLGREVLQAAQEIENLAPEDIAVIPGYQGSLAPSGKQVAFVTAKGPITLRDLATSKDRVLGDHGLEPAISPDGSNLVAMVSATNELEKRQVLLFNPEDDSMRSIGSGLYPTWFSDGSRLFFNDVKAKTLMSISVDDPDAAATPFFQDAQYRYSAVSPDAMKVAIYSQGEVRVVDVTSRETVASHRTNGWRSVLFGWSPDSRYVGFGNTSTQDGSGLWILDVTSGKCFKAISGAAIRPSWSADGRRMLYENWAKNEIHVVQWSPELQQQLLEASDRTNELRQQMTEASAARKGKLETERQWQINRVGLTMMRIPAGTVQNEKGEAIEVASDFLLSDREINVGQFQQFLDDPDYPASEKPEDRKPSVLFAVASPTPEHPVQEVSWFDAVLFCNWLSWKEGRDACYRREAPNQAANDPRESYPSQLQAIEAQREKVAADQPEYGKLLMDQSVLFFQLGQYDQAMEGFERLQEDETRGNDAIRYLAILKARDGESDEARDLLKQFVDGIPEDTPDAVRASFDLYLTMIVESWLGDGQEALDRLGKEIAAHQTNGLYLYNAACACSLSSLAAAHHNQPDLETQLKRSALGLLRMSLDRGQDRQQLSRDADLDPLRDEQGFAELLPTAKAEEETWQLDEAANGYRLPTESEWEYACRAGTTTKFSSGSAEEWLRGYGVYQASRTERCGSKLPNGWGLFDMHGNVWEWCQELYNDEASDRVHRGGCWLHAARFCESSLRSWLVPTSRDFNLGFRVAVVPSSQTSKSREGGAESGSGQSDRAEAEPEPADGPLRQAWRSD